MSTFLRTMSRIISFKNRLDPASSSFAEVETKKAKETAQNRKLNWTQDDNDRISDFGIFAD